MSRILVSLLTYNGAKYLPFCLESLFNQSYQNWQLFVLDNASTDESLKTIQRLTAGRNNVTLLPPQQYNIGFAAGHNKLVIASESEYLLLLNQDVVMSPDYLEKLVTFMEGHERAGAAQGLLLHWDLRRGNAPFAEKSGGMIDSAGLALKRCFQVCERGSGEEDTGRYDGNEEVFGVSGALPVYRRAAFVRAGGFDERFFAYKEDVDLAFRLQHAGWKSFCVGAARAWHERGLGGPADERLRAIVKNRRKKSNFGNYLSYRNHWYVLIKNVALRDWLRYGIVMYWYELKKLVYIALFEPKTLLAWLEILKALPYLLKERRRMKPKSVRKWI